MYELTLFALFIVISGIRNYFILRKKEKIEEELERKFLALAMTFMEYKFYMQQMLDLVHEKAAEIDPQFIAQKESIDRAIEEKYNKFGDTYVQQMASFLPERNIKYKTWKEAVKEADRLFKARKK